MIKPTNEQKYLRTLNEIKEIAGKRPNQKWEDLAIRLDEIRIKALDVTADQETNP